MPADDVLCSFTVPGRFHPGWSLLGRAIRRFCADRLRAEALFVVTLTGLAVLLLLGHYAAWALVGDVVARRPTGPTALLFYGISGGALLVLGLGGGIGFEPPARVVCATESLRIEKGRRIFPLPYGAITSVEAVPARCYHRHYRRYAAVQPFTGRPSDPILLLHTDDSQVVALGLSEADQAALRRYLAAWRGAPARVRGISSYPES